jgi:NAD(P)-dependent dehydrogenase (short-subunit alcohol dehydrogenase family)
VKDWQRSHPLRKRVAVVTGATRGAGKAIASVLGEAGATVYVTGRTARGHPRLKDFPGTIQDTADEVSRRGGVGIAVRCDHTQDADVRRLFAKIRREQHRLDVLVNNVWGGYMPYPAHGAWFGLPFWKQSMERWEGMFTAGVRAHLVTNRYGIPLMLGHRGGLVVSTTYWDGGEYLGLLFYDMAKCAVNRMAFGLVTYPRMYGNITQGLLGLGPDDPRFGERWTHFLSELGKALSDLWPGSGSK